MRYTDRKVAVLGAGLSGTAAAHLLKDEGAAVTVLDSAEERTILKTTIEGLRARGHRMVKPVADVNELASSLRDIAAPGDIIICMGAGDITKWAAGLADGIGKARVSK